ncbi:DBF4-type zinc finger-containing protein 2 isoform X1 [Ailuropoda melanoleuca]|uniref:Zinc finger DBF-type containing 2 n=1 Tax=Ailuropoda melanoleuca TaxID=9646 RepID=A0A7N5KMX0_AILME|nr:DBF4-type zinc finger-containing protein 2 isoform X1 [Ailuropoda melanoleuca]XP_034510943.1 DBF4-type zinc finger-containing protein 2 isoform X1 [Ailuropoda melanoleuca]XP_034510944.1 DBF4-type zinc finger-containing protein 2 isoform X1 [Ailuropoda melanoleuca]
MQSRQGYCSYCCVRYNSLEQHMSSAQHRYLTTQNRQRMGTTSLMERFLQDVLRHHPYHSQESRSTQNERLLTNTASPPEVVPVDDSVSEEATEDATGVKGEGSTKGFEPSKELQARPGKSQEYIQGVSVRPSVIQKLEKGQQQPLGFIQKVGSGMKEFNPVGIGQATHTRPNLICPSVISSAPASCLAGSSFDRPVKTMTTRLPAAASLDSVRKCDPNKVDRYLDQPDRGSRNPVLSSNLETSPVSYQKPKEPNRKSLGTNSDKLIIQEDVKSQRRTLSAGAKAREFMGTEGSLKSESLSKLAVSQAINLNKTGLPSKKGIFEDAAAKHGEKFFSGVDHTQEEERLVFNKSAFLEQKSSVISEVKFARGSRQSGSDQPKEAAQVLWKEEQIDQEDKNYESRASEMSFDCSSPFHSPTGESKVTDKEINLSKEEYADLQCKNNKSFVSEISSDRDGSLPLATNRTQVIVKGVSVQKAKPISLVDESYESSDSEINFECDALLRSTDDYPQQPAKEGSLPKEEHVDLVDKNYGSSSSEVSTDSAFPLQSVGDRLPVAVTEAKLQKVHIGLVDKNYGSSCSETSIDNDASPQSVVEHPHLVVKERNLKDRQVYLKDKNLKSSSAKAHLDYAVSLETVTDESPRAVEEMNLLEEKNEPVDMNYDSHGSEMSFHTDARLVAGQSGVIVKKGNPREIAVDLEEKSVKSSNSDQSSDSQASLYQSASDQREINLKELNVDMEVKSYGCSSSELTFESDPPALSGTEQSEMDMEEIRKRHINLEGEHSGSNSSAITFDSDILLRSGVDQSQVAIYVEEPSHLENKTNQPCAAEITFDSDVPVHSGTNQPELAVKDMIIQKEEYIHLGRKNDEPSGPEISLDFYVPPHSMAEPPEVAMEKLHLQKEEQIYLENKDNEPSGSELSLNYGIFHSMTGHSKDPIKEMNLQEEHIHLGNKGNVPSVSEISLKSDFSYHLMTDHPNIAVKEMSHQKEHIHFQGKDNALSVYETSLDSGVHLHQSVTPKPETAVKEIWLQKERHAKFKSKSAKFSGSETDSNIPHYLVTEPPIAVKEINVQKEEHVLEKKSDKYSSSGIMFGSGVLPHLMTETPHIAVLKEDHVDPEGKKSTGSRGFAVNLDIGAPFHSVIGPPQLTHLKEQSVPLEDKNRESSHCKIRYDSGDPLQLLTGKFQEVVKKTNLRKEGKVVMKNKMVQTKGSKLIRASLPSVADKPEGAVKRVNLENEGHVTVEDKNSQCSGSEMSLDSDFLVESIIDQPQITILDQDHIELEDKHSQSGGSEMSFDSEDPLQSVAEQVRETVKEISLWKDEVDVEDKRDEPKGFEMMYDSNVLFQSVAAQTEEVVKGMDLWKEQVDLQGKIGEPSDPKINFDSNEPLQSVANEIQDAIAEINLLREGHVCLGDKGYEPSDSEIIYVSNVPLQSMVEQPHLLEGEHASLEDKSNIACGPEITFITDDHLQSVADQLQKSVKEVSLWKEDHIYLEDKSYKLGDFEVSYDSDVPVHFVTDQSPLAVKEINLQKRGHHDLEDKSCRPSVSEIKCDSGIHFQLEVDQSEVVCKEIDLPKEGHLGMEVKTSEPSDSELMCDSDVPLEIVVNELQVSVKEANLRKMLFVDLVTSDSDCEVIAESDMPFQPVIDSPHMTVKEINCINTEGFDLEGECCDSCGSEIGYVCEASPQSLANQSKETFKVVNQKKDYIILQESSCESYGSEINFQIDPPDRSVTYSSQGSDKEMVKYIDSEEKSCGSDSPKTNFKWEDDSQPMADQLQKEDKAITICQRKGLENTGRKDKHGECCVSAVRCNASSGSAAHQRASKGKLLKLKHADPESMSCEPCGSGMSFQCAPSLQSDTDQPQETVNKTGLYKKMSLDLEEINRDPLSSSIFVVDPVRNLEKAKEVIEDNPDEPVLEALPHVPPSFVGKTWSQIMREDDMKINALVKEFKEGRFHCYFDDDCETRKIKKKNLNEGKKITWTDASQDTATIQVLSDCDDNAGGISDTDDFSVALDKTSHHSTVKRPYYEQSWRVASRCQAVKVSHGTQTNFTHQSDAQDSGQEDDSPTGKRSLLQDKKTKKKVKIGTLEFPETCTKVLKPLQPNALVYVISSNMKFQDSETANFSKKYRTPRSRDVSIQYKYKRSSFNYYDPLSKKIVINPPLSIDVSDPDRTNWLQANLSDLSSSSGDEDAEGCDPTAVLTIRDELLAYPGAPVSPERAPQPGTSSASAAPKESNYQFTLVNREAAGTSSKAVTRTFLEGKKKIQRRMTANENKPDFPQKVYKPISLHPQPRIASEKRPIWIQTKLNDIIRKYLSKYSAFLRRKYQSRSAFSRLHLQKKKGDVPKVKVAKSPAQMVLRSSVPRVPSEPPVSSGPPVPSVPPGPSVAAAGERLIAAPSSAPKQPGQGSCPPAGRKRNGSRKRPRKKRRKLSRPVKIYALRSLYSQVPYSDRMRTRLSNKQRANETA